MADSGGTAGHKQETAVNVDSESQYSADDLKRMDETRKENLEAFIGGAAKSNLGLDLAEGFYDGSESKDHWHMVDDKDIEEHRIASFRTHQPVVGDHHHHHHRKHKKHRGDKTSHRDKSEKGPKTPSTPLDSADTAKPLATAESQVSAASGDPVSFYVGDQQAAAEVAEAAKAPEEDGVDFFVGEEEGMKDEDGVRRSKRRHPRPFSEKDLALRRHRGSEVKLKDADKENEIEADDEEDLNEQDMVNMTNHRFYEAKGQSRKKASKSALASLIYVGRNEKKKKKHSPEKRQYDHSPHEMFVEMDELHVGDDDEWKWSERARWIKFEEDAEEGAERWGRPHVASLSFHCLLELRQCLQQGAVIMDLEADDLTSIVNHVVDQLVITDQLEPENRGAVLQALLLKHTHVGGDKPSGLRRNLTQLNLLRRSSTSGSRRGSIGRRQSDASHKSHSIGTPKSKQKNGVDGKYTKMDDELPTPTNGSTSQTTKDFYDLGKVPNVEVSNGTDDQKRDHVQIPMDEFSDTQSDRVSIQRSFSQASAMDQEDKKERSTHHSQDILRCIPKDSEATTVLVGAVDFLSQPIMAFVRLAEGRYLGNLTEVNLPVRFIFILMGPKSSGMDYYEIGRSLSTLMANRNFHDVAYKAENHEDMINAINEFLDDSIVLPPGDYNKDTLLPIMSIVNKENEARKRRRARLKGQAEAEAKPDDPFGDPLKRTGRPFGGLINDIKRRYPKYLSDIKDGLNLQCLATFFFVYFACLSPAITFGGLLSEKTEKLLGVSEMLIGVSVCGVIMALFAGQPILILGATGPMLVFEEALYQICGTMNLPFLEFRVWCGFWVTIIAVLLVCFEGSFLVRYFTRFIQEIFALLISLIFIIETFIKLARIFQQHPLKAYYPAPEYVNDTLNDVITHVADFITSPPNSSLFERDVNATGASMIEDDIQAAETDENQPNTALLSLVLCLGTFFIAYFLKQFRNSKFLGRPVRRAIGDFGVPIAIVVMVLIDYFLKDTYTEKLDVPDGMTPTAGDLRGWVINPIGSGDNKLEIWAYFLAVVPALLVFILIFMESEITSMIVNKKDRKLKKGSGYHLDLLLIGAFGSLCGILGLPFVCAATVRSVTHVSALTSLTTNQAPGEKAQVAEVKEQRMTGVLVHIVIGISVLMGPVLRMVPLAVLFGVFLYMGVASLAGIQMLDRIKMIFMPVKHHPYVPYVRRVKTYRMHLYTFIQILAIAALWAVKSTAAALAFPFILIILVPIRLCLLKYIFTPKELSVLDCEGEGEDFEEDEEEPDFYKQAHMPN